MRRNVGETETKSDKNADGKANDVEMKLDDHANKNVGTALNEDLTSSCKLKLPSEVLSQKLHMTTEDNK